MCPVRMLLERLSILRYFKSPIDSRISPTNLLLDISMALKKSWTLLYTICYFHWIIVIVIQMVCPHVEIFFFLNICQVVIIVQSWCIPISKTIKWQISSKNILREIKDSQVWELIIGSRLSNILPYNWFDRKMRSSKFWRFSNQDGKVSLNWLLLTSKASTMYNWPMILVTSLGICFLSNESFSICFHRTYCASIEEVNH